MVMLRGALSLRYRFTVVVSPIPVLTCDEPFYRRQQSNQTCYQTALGGPAMPPPTLSLPGIIPDPGHLGSAAVVGVGHSATSSNANGTAGAVSPSNGSHAHLNGVGLANTTTGIPGSQQHTHQQPYPPAAAVNMAPTPWAGRPNGRPLSGDLSPFPGTVHGTVPGQPAAGVGTGTGVTNGMGIGTQARMASAVAGGVRAPQDASQSLPHGQPGRSQGVMRRRGRRTPCCSRLLCFFHAESLQSRSIGEEAFFFCSVLFFTSLPVLFISRCHARWRNAPPCDSISGFVNILELEV